MTMATEVILGIRQVKMFSAEGRLKAAFDEMARQMSHANLRLQALPLLAQPVGEIVAACVMTVSVMVLSGGLRQAGPQLIPVLVTLLVVLARLLPLVGSLNKDAIKLKAELASVNEVTGFLARPPASSERGHGRPFERLREAIRFERVGFAYPGHADGPVLTELSLTVSKGRTTAIVGPSGAGKSTIVDLVARLYEPTTGRITIDGVDLREHEVASWRRAIGFVSQDTFIFNASIRENIVFALPQASDDEIVWAAQQADAHEFIRQLPRGYETVVGERGLKLSGGQRQRIAIARAVLRRPTMLIFDEATSSLDQESEQRVQRAIERISQDRTVMVVAHRLSTVLAADHIIVLDRGRVAEQGTHHELLERDGLYRRLYRSDGLSPEPRPTEAPAALGELSAT